jgi:hypothetical protein
VLRLWPRKKRSGAAVELGVDEDRLDHPLAFCVDLPGSRSLE